MAFLQSYQYYMNNAPLAANQPTNYVYNQRNQYNETILPPRKFIISGASGVGKTHYIQNDICKTCHFQNIITIHGSDLFTFTDIGDGEAYLLKQFTAITNSSDSSNDKKYSNTELNLIIFESIDAIFGTPFHKLETNGKVEASMSIRRYLSLFKQLLYSLPQNIFFVCTTSAEVETLEPQIFGYKLIERIIKIPLPNQIKRYEILNAICNNHDGKNKCTTDANENSKINTLKCKIKCESNILQQISEEINGYTPADITQLYREIVLKKLIQMKIQH